MMHKLSSIKRNLGFIHLSARSAVETWAAIRNGSKGPMGPFIRVASLVLGHCTPAVALLCLAFCRHYYRIYKSSGFRGLSLYTKAASIAVMRAAGSDKLSHTNDFGVRVGLTKGGIPRFIPSWIRKQIKLGDPLWIRVVMTLLGVYRVLPFEGVPSVATIVRPWTGKSPKGHKDFVPVFFSRFPGDPSRVLFKSFTWRWLRILKSAPGASGRTSIQTSMSVMFKSLICLWDDGPLREAFTAVGNILGFERIIAKMDKSYFLIKSDPSLESYFLKMGQKGDRYLGRLGMKAEPGKARIFAMVDYWTQCLLHPLHEELFKALRKVPQDCTFDQGRGVNDVMKAVRDGTTRVYSFDLSAATDRLPVTIQRDLLDFLLPGLGEPWRVLLVGRKYKCGLTASLPKDVTYSVGQPMGAYSSWAMLAMTHHYLIQFCATEVGFLDWFTDYRILGDDVVIWNREVALRYLALMRELGVDIARHKSIVSRNGSAEFAKRYIWKGVDCSPIPLKEAGIARTSLAALAEFIQRHAPTVRLGTFLSFLGKGYRAKSRSGSSFLAMGRSTALPLIFMSQPGLSSWSVENWYNWIALTAVGVSDSPVSYWTIFAKLAEYFDPQKDRNRSKIRRSVEGNIGEKPAYSFIEKILGIEESDEEYLSLRGSSGSAWNYGDEYGSALAKLEYLYEDVHTSLRVELARRSSDLKVEKLLGWLNVKAEFSEEGVSACMTACLEAGLPLTLSDRWEEKAAETLNWRPGSAEDPSETVVRTSKWMHFWTFGQYTKGSSSRFNKSLK